MSVRRTRLFLTAAGAALLVAVSGCAADSKDSAAPSSADRGAVAPGAVPAEGGAGPAKEQQPNQNPGQDTGQKAPGNLDVENRSIIYAGTMTVRVDDVDAAAARAISLATAAGGFVGGDNRRRDDRRSTGTLVLRIPAAKFTPTLEQLKELGDEEDRTVTAQDVTDQVVDVQARLDNAEASVERIRALLARATTIGEITSLESELSRRLSDLESLQARKRKLDGLTALSTITLQLLGPEAAITRDKDEIGVVAGFKDGMTAFLASLQVALTVLGWLAPWVLLLGVPLYVLVRLYRRFRPKRPAPAAAGAQPAGPLPGWSPPAFPVAPRPGAVPPARGPVSAPPAGGQVSAPPAQGAVAAPPAQGAAGQVSAPPAQGVVSAPPVAGPVAAPPAGGPGDGGGAGPVPEPSAGGRGPDRTPPARRAEDDPKDR
ncbi:DUF4349 domain-containing protein [Dactylosporangium aurantiacum]|uniref:DUF4349 domain-containing protein n=1 Tax=Dactylosporangium aurantiacum TaxID=35754 RepID=A0A9Q9IG01_9ACTN|nr:DUF4349 domain-containing protein [Dactylosporangium aurantiacum]MDG6110216.1 DUF4349 domain-containing protein [Dactylosporangium aurantiacum]UWZ55499.1 DUF4349 domain-containing protein [Dactylosporangium aurantiacum]